MISLIDSTEQQSTEEGQAVDALEKTRVDRILELHSQVVGYAKMTLAGAIEIGGLLAEQRAEMKYGEWGPWCEKNLPFDIRTARRYMMVWKEREKTDTVSDLTEAYRLLAPPKHVIDHAEWEDEREEERSSDEYQRHQKETYKKRKREKAEREGRVSTGQYITIWEWEETNAIPGAEKDETREAYTARIAEYKAARDQVVEALKERQRDVWREKYGAAAVSEKGVRMKCRDCGKLYWTQDPDDEKPLCGRCDAVEFLRDFYPDNEINPNKLSVKFTCQHCGKEYWRTKKQLLYTHWASEKGGHSRWQLHPPRPPSIPRRPSLFCSGWCEYRSKRKTEPTFTEAEWIDRVKAERARVQMQEEVQEQILWNRHGYTNPFSSFFGSVDYGKEYELGDAQQDADQTALLDALVEYFEGFEDINRRLNAIHNVVKHLRWIANGCQQTIANGDQEEELQEVRAIEA